ATCRGCVHAGLTHFTCFELVAKRYDVTSPDIARDGRVTTQTATQRGKLLYVQIWTNLNPRGALYKRSCPGLGCAGRSDAFWRVNLTHLQHSRGGHAERVPFSSFGTPDSRDLPIMRRQ